MLCNSIQFQQLTPRSKVPAKFSLSVFTEFTEISDNKTRMHSSRICTARRNCRFSCNTCPPLRYTPLFHAPSAMHAPLLGTPPAMHAPMPHTPIATHTPHACPPITTHARHAPLPHTSPLWTEFLTHACENITLPQTSFPGGKYLLLR